jgi:integrase
MPDRVRFRRGVVEHRLELAEHVRGWQAHTILVNELGAQLSPGPLGEAVRSARGKVPGLPPGFRYHDLRHYFASLLIVSGADVKVVQARLRHATGTTTIDTYGHLWPDRTTAHEPPSKR